MKSQCFSVCLSQGNCRQQHHLAGNAEIDEVALCTEVIPQLLAPGIQHLLQLHAEALGDTEGVDLHPEPSLYPGAGGLGREYPEWRQRQAVLSTLLHREGVGCWIAQQHPEHSAEIPARGHDLTAGHGAAGSLLRSHEVCQERLKDGLKEGLPAALRAAALLPAGPRTLLPRCFTSGTEARRIPGRMGPARQWFACIHTLEKGKFERWTLIVPYSVGKNFSLRGW